MEWDYEKLFAAGNIIGSKYHDKINIEVIDDGDYEYYKPVMNKQLSSSYEEIQYIIRLDEHGNIAEHLFDRSKDMPKPMPQLESGMFVSVYDNGADEDYLGVVINGSIVYQDGTYDRAYRFGVYGESDGCHIKKVWDTRAKSFDSCKTIESIWEAKE